MEKNSNIHIYQCIHRAKRRSRSIQNIAPKYLKGIINPNETAAAYILALNTHEFVGYVSRMITNIMNQATITAATAKMVNQVICRPRMLTSPSRPPSFFICSWFRSRRVALASMMFLSSPKTCPKWWALRLSWLAICESSFVSSSSVARWFWRKRSSIWAFSRGGRLLVGRRGGVKEEDSFRGRVSSEICSSARPWGSTPKVDDPVAEDKYVGSVGGTGGLTLSLKGGVVGGVGGGQA